MLSSGVHAAGSTARPQRQAMVSAVAECAAFVAKSEDPRMREVTERFLASVVAPRALGLAVATKDTPTHKHLGKHLDGPFAREAAARVVASVLAAEGDCAAVLKAWLTAQAKTEGDITGKCAEWTALFLAVREAFGRRPSRTEDSGGDEDGLRGIADELVAKGLQGMRADVGDVATAEFVWTMLPRASAGVAREAGEAAAKCLLLCDLPSPAATACARLLVEAVRAGEGDAATWRGALRAFVEDPLRQRALRGLALCLQALLAGADGGVRHSGGGPGVEVEEAASLAMEAATSSRVFGDATRASVLDRMARAGLMPSQVAAQAFAGLVSSVLPRALESPCKPAATVQSWGVLRDAGPQLVATALADAGGSDGEGARGVWDTVVQALAGLLKRTFGASDADVRDAAAALEAATRVGGGAVVDRTATEGLQRGAARVAWAGVQSGLASKGITSDSSKRLWGEVCESAKEDLCSHVRNATAVMGRLCHSSLGSVVGIADDVCRVVRLEDCGNSGLMEAVMEAVTNAVPASVDAMDASRPAHVALLGALAHKLGSAVVFGTRAGAAAMADVLAVAGSGTEGPPAAERTSGSDKPELAVGAAVGRLAAGAVLSGVLGRHVWDAEDAHGIETGSTASSNDSGEDGRDAETLPSGDGGSDLVERLTNMADLQRLPALACGGRDDRAVGELEAFAPVEVDPVSVSALQHALADLLAQDTNARSGALRWGCYALGVAALAGRHAARGGHGVSSAGIECLLTACREVYRAARAGIVESTERREAPEAWAVQKMAIVTSSLGPALASIEVPHAMLLLSLRVQIRTFSAFLTASARRWESRLEVDDDFPCVLQDATLEEDSKRWLDALTSQPTPAIASQDSSAETEKAARGTSVSYLRLAVAAHTLPVLVRRDPSDASGYSQRMAQRAVDLMRSQLTLVAMSGGGFGASGRPDGDSLDEEDELDAAGTSGVPETHQSRDELVGATWAALAHGMGLLDAADWELVLEFLASELTQAVAAFEEVAEAVSDAGWAAAEQQQGDARGDEAFADVIFREGGSSSMLDAASASGADAVARASRKTHSSARTAELLCRCVSMVCGIAESGSGTRAQGSVLPRERTCVPSHTLAGFVATAVLDVVRLVVAAGSVAAVGMACSRGHSEGVSGVSGVSLIVRRWRTSVASQSQLWDAVGKALASLTESGHVTPTSLQQAYNESLDWAPDSGAHPSLALLAACACAGSAPITAPSARILCSPAFLRGAVVASVRGDDTSSQEAAPADWEHERVLAPWLECHLVNEGGVTWLAWTLSALAMFDMAVDGPESPSPEKGGEDRDAAHAAVCDALQSLVTRPAGSRYMNSLAWAAVETGAASAGRQVKGSEGAQPSEGSSGQFLGRHASAWEMLDRGAGLSQLLCGGADPGGVWTQAVVHACLWGMPAVVREWFLQQRDKALATSLKRYVMAVESPLLLQLEVSRCQVMFGNVLVIGYGRPCPRLCLSRQDC